MVFVGSGKNVTLCKLDESFSTFFFKCYLIKTLKQIGLQRTINCVLV